MFPGFTATTNFCGTVITVDAVVLKRKGVYVEIGWREYHAPTFTSVGPWVNNLIKKNPLLLGRALRLVMKVANKKCPKHVLPALHVAGIASVETQKQFRSMLVTSRRDTSKKINDLSLPPANSSFGIRELTFTDGPAPKRKRRDQDIRRLVYYLWDSAKGNRTELDTLLEGTIRHPVIRKNSKIRTLKLRGVSLLSGASVRDCLYTVSD